MSTWAPLIGILAGVVHTMQISRIAQALDKIAKACEHNRSNT